MSIDSDTAKKMATAEVDARAPGQLVYFQECGHSVARDRIEEYPGSAAELITAMHDALTDAITARLQAEGRAEAAEYTADAVYNATLGSAANPIAMADAIRIERLRSAALDAFTLIRRAENSGRKTVQIADVVAEFEKHAHPRKEG